MKGKLKLGLFWILVGVVVGAGPDSIKTLPWGPTERMNDSGVPWKPPVAADKIIEGKVKTVFGSDGRPINQSQEAKGYHRISGEIKMVNGRDTIELNSSANDGRNDVTFIGIKTYTGSAWSLVASNTKSYRLIPLAGNKFEIISTDSLDTATVQYMVEGE